MDQQTAAAGEATLDFWVTPPDDDDAAANGSMGLFSRDGETVLCQVPLGPLRRNLTQTVETLQQIFADIAERSDVLPLAEAQLSFQVTAAGGVHLIGTGQMQSSRGLTLTFRG